ncbi:MAG: hypothetical protein BWK76_22555 [Desulfobulbaceae bacterium A2]|nr:MAG: hypothetical protein BWK76_22555 [Desulfobulbaceae bacterium A2]
MMHSDIDLLRELGRPGWEDLARAFQTRIFARKAPMFGPKETHDAVFIVTGGRARVYLAYDDKEFTLVILERGDVYSTHTRAYVAALEETSILISETVQIRKQLLRIPEFTGTMVRVLGEVLRHSLGIIDNLAFRDVENRLRCFLQFECSRTGVAQPDGGVLLDLGLTTEHLASMMGTTRQTLSTIMNGLARGHILEMRGRGTLFIPDPTALTGEAGQQRSL